TYFTDISGLEPGNSVKLAGVKIGFVENVIPLNDKVRVVLAIDKRYKIKTDATAKIMMETLLTGKYIYINFGKSEKYLKDGDFIPAVGITDIDQIVVNVKEITDEVKGLIASFNENQNRTLNNINKLIEENSPKVSSILTNVDNVVGSIKKEDIQNILEDIKKTTTSLTKVSNNIQILSEKITNGEGTLGKLIAKDDAFNGLMEAVGYAKKTFENLYTIIEKNDTNITMIVAELRESMPDLKKSINNIKEITESINKGEGTLGKIIKDEELYKEVKGATKSMNQAIEDQREQSVISSFANMFFSLFGF
ncbi:MAG TPA: MlaD family protein, partial [bacterium]|nr:MlaD family protein [bacterium]